MRNPVILHAVALVLLTASSPSPAQQTYYVRPGGNDASNGLSWAGAKATIQAAIDTASAADTIRVTNGTYTLTAAISLLKGLTLEGVSGAAVTVVDANANDGSRRHVITINAPGALVEGFTFKRGNAWAENNPVGAWSAGVVISNGTLRGCIIRDNVMRYDSPGVGGLAVRGAALVENCWITGNSVGRGGIGGVYNKGGKLRNCVITSNWCGNIGYSRTHERMAGGVVQESGDMAFCTIARNWSPAEMSGGLSLIGGTVSNCIVYFNYNPSLRSLDHRNTWNTCKTGGTMAYSCTTPAVSGTGNVSADPQFADRHGQNYHLLAGSPCIDTGTNMAGTLTDYDGSTRPRDGDRDGKDEPDMGAYEAEHATGGVFRCDFTVTPSENVGTNLAVLAAHLSGPETNTTWYRWDLGNGSILQGSGLRKVTNGYDVGTYDVNLRVSNTISELAVRTKAECLYVAPRSVYVAQSSGNIFPYGAWSNATTNIQLAIETAVVVGTNASTVVVSNGTYTMADYMPLVLHKGCTVKSANGRQYTWLTRSSSKGLYFRVAELYHPGAVLEGFSITNGAFTQNGANWNDYGGGIYMTMGTVRDCLITGCQAPNGGGVYMLGGLLDRCILRGNAAMAGYMYLCGGGVNMQGGMARNCLFEKNRTTDSVNAPGGGLSMAANTRVENCTFVGNTIASTNAGPQHSGAGIYRDANSSVVTNCIVYGNLKAGQPNDITNRSGVAYASVGYSCSPSLVHGNNWCITNVPQFRDAAGGDYRLKERSPGVDAGYDYPWGRTALDLAGEARRKNRMDMGAYEYQWPYGMKIVVQ